MFSAARARPASRLALGVALGATVGGCSKSPEPCTTVGTCPDQTECLANRCVPLGGEPVDARTDRIVLWPQSFAVVSGRAGGEPAIVTFGGAEGATLYLSFSPAWRRYAEIESAFLLLEPAPATLPSSGTVPVASYRVVEPWRADALSPTSAPELGLPKSEGLARTGPPTTLRIDVTRLLRYLADHPRASHGVAVRGEATDGIGASFATGSGLGRAPRLELYVR